MKDLTEWIREEERERLAELQSTIGTTRQLGEQPGAALAHGGTMVDHLGWMDVVVNLVEPSGRWRVAWTSSDALDDDLLGEVYEPAAFAAALHPRFLRAGAWFVPEEAEIQIDGPDHVPDQLDGPEPDSWRTRDMLLVPMRDEREAIVGMLSMDRPASGLRPTDTEIEVLGLVAAHAALALGLTG